MDEGTSKDKMQLPLTWQLPVPEGDISIQRLAVLIQIFEQMDERERQAALRYCVARWPG